MQYIGDGILVTGYILVALVIFVALVCMAWVIYYRAKSQLGTCIMPLLRTLSRCQTHHQHFFCRSVRVSQPPFMIMLCCGCIISVSSVIPMGIQTKYRYVIDGLTGTPTAEENPDIAGVDAACMMVPWLYSLGFAMVYSSLYAKVYRVRLIFK